MRYNVAEVEIISETKRLRMRSYDATCICMKCRSDKDSFELLLHSNNFPALESRFRTYNLTRVAGSRVKLSLRKLNYRSNKQKNSLLNNVEFQRSALHS